MKPEQLDEIERILNAGDNYGHVLNRDTVSALIAEVRHWKANHDNQVVRARFLIERGDIPLERVRAYEEMAELRAEIKRLRTELNDFTTAAGEMNAEVVRLREREEKYQRVCAAAYQMAGTVNAPVRFLDALSDASCGEFDARGKIENLLPVTPDETGSFLSDQGEEFREDAERWRWLCEKNADVDSPWCVENGYVWVEYLRLEVDDARHQDNPNATD
jgi:hypothetical protein